MSTRISIIIPAFNEESELPATLQSAQAAISTSGLACEIIVSDDNSTDATAKVAQGMGATVHHANCRQISANRNAGASIAQGEIFLFVDADTRITPESLTAVDESVTAGAGGGGALIQFDRPCPLWARMMMLPMMWIFPRAKLASGAFIYCRRDLFETIGGFDEEYYVGEEIIMSRAIAKNARFVLVRSPVVTSARKLREYSFFSMIRIMATMLVGGHRWARKKQGKAFWYDDRELNTPPH